MVVVVTVLVLVIPTYLFLSGFHPHHLSDVKLAWSRARGRVFGEVDLQIDRSLDTTSLFPFLSEHRISDLRCMTWQTGRQTDGMMHRQAQTPLVMSTVFVHLVD